MKKNNSTTSDSKHELVTPNQRKSTKVAIYVRVSTEEQKRDGFSIRAQIEKLTQYASIKDWTIHDIYDDKGISGKNIEKRPNLKRMIDDVKDKKVDVILVFKLDRLTRSIRDLMELTDIFNDNKCEFCSLTENIDTHTASGRMFLKILGIFAEFERENLIERVKSGLERKAKEGYSNSKSIICLGYDRPKGEKILTINEEEAKLVNQIFSAFANDFKNEYQIAKELNHMNIKTKYDNYWTLTYVKEILTNPTYIGKTRYCIKDTDRYEVFEGKHEPIIDIELFKKVNNRIANRDKIIFKKRPKEDAFFTGLLKCNKCDGKMYGHKNYKTKENGDKASHIEYSCINRKHGACNQGYISQKKLENVFIEYINNIENLSVSNELEVNSKNINNDDKINGLTKDIEKQKIKSKKIMEMYLNEKISFDEYREMTAIVDCKIVMIDNQILELEEMQKDNDIELNHEDIVINIKENWLAFDNKQKMDFLQAFVESITVDTEKENGSNFNRIMIKKIAFRKED